ncbi:hypothetical protein BGZ95_001037 [Linnemannia exigua]|uniref:Uncharacterized protein n=1 Tax=Linnemannia exigua TaxID=604196 RepID=A0AAD4D7G1_9FUNG|nr:hypothetical protein BGZ95_001037 [Linnemannia exigua]
MGKIKLLCLTADPGLTTLYGFAYGFSSSEAQMKKDMDTLILIKSQANPSNIADIKWSTVSVFITSTRLTDISTRHFPNHACAVNSAGVFTTIDNSAIPWQGVRFDPAGRMAPEYNLTGGGAWSTIALSPIFNMTEYQLNDIHKLFYIQNGDKETLFHVYSRYSMAAPAVHIGVVNETGGRPTLESSAIYKCSRMSKRDGAIYDSQLETINSVLTDKTTRTMTRFSKELDKVTPTSQFQTIGGHLPGQEAFAAISFRTGIHGITLTGPSAGTLQDMADVYIDGVYGDDSDVQNGYLTPSGTPPAPTESSEKYSIELDRRRSSEIELKGVKMYTEADTLAVVPPPLIGLTNHPRPAVITSVGSAIP